MTMSRAKTLTPKASWEVCLKHRKIRRVNPAGVSGFPIKGRPEAAVFAVRRGSLYSAFGSKRLREDWFVQRGASNGPEPIEGILSSVTFCSADGDHDVRAASGSVKAVVSGENPTGLPIFRETCRRRRGGGLPFDASQFIATCSWPQACRGANPALTRCHSTRFACSWPGARRILRNIARMASSLSRRQDRGLAPFRAL
jgi:hypothetical protein